MDRLNRRRLGISALGILAAGLALAAPAAALADATPAGPHARSEHALHGTFKNWVTNTSTTKVMLVTVTHGDTTNDVDVDVTHARLLVPGARGRQQRLGTADLSNVFQGDEVVAQGTYSSDGKTFNATRLHLVPGSRSLHAVGTASVSGSTITVKKSDNTTVSFTFNNDTKVRPEGKKVADANNQRVTVVGRRENGNNVATGVVIHA